MDHIAPRDKAVVGSPKQTSVSKAGVVTCLLLCLLSGGANHVFGQSVPPPPSPGQANTPVFHLTTRMVVVDVVVLDKAGHPVGDLDRSQFEVTEDGVPQKIAAFDPPSNHKMPAGSETHPLVNGTADLARIGNAPVDILVLDELNNSFHDAAYARSEMLKFLAQQPAVLPVPTQLIAAGESHFQVLDDYTQSRSALEHAVEKYFPPLPVQRLDSVDLMVETLGVLSQITESSRGTPGRKCMLWVGSGYPSVNTTDLPTPIADKLQSAIRMVTNRMLEARVSLSMIDPKGVQVVSEGGNIAGDPEDPVAAIDNVTGPFAGSLDFGAFVTATGGQLIFNRNDVDVQIGRSADNSQVYYTLSYTSSLPSDAPAAYRTIRVRLKDASLRAIARDGYFSEDDSPDPPPTVSEPMPMVLKFDLLSAVKTRLPYNGLTVRAAQTPGGFRLAITRKDLQWALQPDHSARAELTIVAGFFNTKDKLLQSKAMEIKQTARPGLDVSKAPEVKLDLPLAIPPGTVRVRFAVRDAGTGKLGTADWER